MDYSDEIPEDEVVKISAKFIENIDTWMINFKANYHMCIPQVSLNESDY